MSNCGSFLFLLVIFLMVTSGMGLRLPFSSDRNRPWRQLAREFSGVFTGGGLFVTPTLRFTYGSRRTTLTSRKGVTTLTMTCPIVDLECDIVSRDANGRRWTTQLPEVAMDDEAFDRRYRVCTNDAVAARNLLSSGVLAAIEKLVGMRFTAPVRVSFRAGQLTVVKRASLSGYPVLVLFVRTCLELFDQAMLTRAEGIEFSSEQLVDDFRPLDDVKCQVCGDVIGEDDLVSCRRCHTPHHQECWDYYGSCTVYGCQESDYERPLTPTLIRYITPGSALEEEGVPNVGVESQEEKSQEKSQVESLELLEGQDELVEDELVEDELVEDELVEDELVEDELEVIESEPAETAEAENSVDTAHGSVDGTQAGAAARVEADSDAAPSGADDADPRSDTGAPITPHESILTDDDHLPERTAAELDHEGS